MVRRLFCMAQDELEKSIKQMRHTDDADPRKEQLQHVAQKELEECRATYQDLRSKTPTVPVTPEVLELQEAKADVEEGAPVAIHYRPNRP